MRIKRKLAACLLCVLTAASLVFPASAHGCGHYGGRRGQNTVQPAAIAVCPVEGCTTAGRHVHSGVTYCGNHHEAGYCAGTCAAASTGTGHRHGCHH